MLANNSFVIWSKSNVVCLQCAKKFEKGKVCRKVCLFLVFVVSIGVEDHLVIDEPTLRRRSRVIDSSLCVYLMPKADVLTYMHQKKLSILFMRSSKKV